MCLPKCYPLHLLLFINLILTLSHCTEPSPEKEVIRPVWAMAVGEPGNISSRQLPGRARASQEVDLSFHVAGTLVERPVNVGTEVKAGDIIAVLNPKDFQANVRSTRASLNDAQGNFTRAEDLIKKSFISRAEYDRLKARVDVAQASHDIAVKALADSVIKAPFDGRISAVFVENFQSVRAKTKVARLLDISKVEMVLNLTEGMMVNIPYVETLTASFDAFPGIEIPATIKEVGTEASQTTRTFPVTIEMEQPEGITVLAGMAGSVRATGRTLSDRNETITVPVNAVFTPDTSKQDSVWVIDPETKQVNLVTVKTGILTKGGLEVFEGLESGALIAVAGVHSLREGQTVAIHRIDED